MWEALYVGVVPIVEHSTLDPLFEKLPVMIVDSYEALTAQHLEKEYPRFEKMMAEARASKADGYEVMKRGYWKDMIENRREQALIELGLEEVSPRRRCWGDSRW